MNKTYKKEDFVLNDTSPELLEVWDSTDGKFYFSVSHTKDFHAYKVDEHGAHLLGIRRSVKETLALINEQ